VSEVWQSKRMDNKAGFISLRTLWIANIDLCGHDFPGYKETFTHMVSGHLVFNGAKIWNQRTWIAAGAWARQLSHLMDMAPQTEMRHGPT